MGGGGGQGGLNLPIPVPFNPGSRPVFFGSRPFAFFRLRNIAQCCVIFPFFSRFSPPWESRFPPPLLSPPVHLPPPFLPVSRPPVPPPPPNLSYREIVGSELLLLKFWISVNKTLDCLCKIADIYINATSLAAEGPCQK